MRAVVLRRGELVVDEVPEPRPGPRQVLLKVEACGICGTDLHCRRHAESFVTAARRSGLSIFEFDWRRDLVMGHEFSGRILAAGPDVQGVTAGMPVVAHPMVLTPSRIHTVGFSSDYPGAYGERVVVDAHGVLELPDGCDPTLAALTEPLAVGLHAVNVSRAVERGSAVVIGCGPVGLATIMALALHRVPLVVAADLSPARRTLAQRLGAHVTVDPRTTQPIDAWRDAGGHGPTVVFEAVGVPGMLQAAMEAAPPHSQIVVVGLCMRPDGIEPTVGVAKQLNMQFVLGWTADEFRQCLHAISARPNDVAPLVTGRVGLDETPHAFEELATPDRHGKVVVVPSLN